MAGQTLARCHWPIHSRGRGSWREETHPRGSEEDGPGERRPVQTWGQREVHGVCLGPASVRPTILGRESGRVGTVGVGVSAGEYTCFCVVCVRSRACVCSGVCLPVCPHLRACTCVCVNMCVSCVCPVPCGPMCSAHVQMSVVECVTVCGVRAVVTYDGYEDVSGYVFARQFLVPGSFQERRLPGVSSLGRGTHWHWAGTVGTSFLKG